MNATKISYTLNNGHTVQLSYTREQALARLDYLNQAERTTQECAPTDSGLTRRNYLGEAMAIRKAFALSFALSPCLCSTPMFDSLYPKSVYRCDDCGTVHGTRPVACAVNWQCPNEFIRNETYHEPANQTYIGATCIRCYGFVPKK